MFDGVIEGTEVGVLLAELLEFFLVLAEEVVEVLLVLVVVAAELGGLFEFAQLAGVGPLLLLEVGLELQAEVLDLFPLFALDDQLFLHAEDLVLAFVELFFERGCAIACLFCGVLGPCEEGVGACGLLVVAGAFLLVLEAAFGQLSDLDLVIFIIENLAF